MCALRVTRHTSIRYSSSCHTRVNMGATIRAFRHGSLQQWRISTHPCWRVCDKNLNILSMCAVSPVVRTSNISSRQKKLFSAFLWLWTSPLRWSFGFLVINVCNHGVHYETPCMSLYGMCRRTLRLYFCLVLFLILLHTYICEPGGVVGIALSTGWTVGGSNPDGGPDFSYPSIPALGPIQARAMGTGSLSRK
jgi:hypothetical protein